MSADVSAVVSLKNVWVRYGDKPVLEDINLTIRKKEIVSIVGPNGSGKTTLLRTLLGMLRPYTGEVSVFGKSSAMDLPAGTIAYLPQISFHERSFPVSVMDVVSMSMRAAKSTGRRLNGEEKNRLSEALDKVGMSDFSGHHFGTLSGGQQQRIIIARALAVKPRFLIMDEPSTGLDAVAQDTFYHLLQKLRDEDELTILFVSHDVGAVSNIVDTIACLNRSIHFHGSPSQGIPPEALEKVFGSGMNILLHDEECETCRRKR